MHIIIINYVYSPEISTPDHLLHVYFLLTGWVDGLISAGANVTVFQRFHIDDLLSKNGAEYHFISDHQSPRMRTHQIPLRLHREVSRTIRKLNQSHEQVIIHVNGLIFPSQVLHLRLYISNKYALVVQHHAEPPQQGIHRLLQRIGLSTVDGFMFSTHDHAQDWIRAGFVQNSHLIGEIMETSSTLSYEARNQARKRTDFSGDPILLWTGNLNENKDPLTILEGLKKILEVRPDTRLYMAYRYDDLLKEVNDLINSSEKLKRAVRLLGPIPYSDIASYYNSADYFVQGSHREGSGIAVLDALACGVVPVVTNIPSFRVMTDEGRIGALWSVGDPQAFVNAYLSLIYHPIDQQSLAAKNFFEANFSFERIGKKALSFYDKVIAQKSRPPLSS